MFMVYLKQILYAYRDVHSYTYEWEKLQRTIWSNLLNERVKLPIETWLDQSMYVRISTLWLCMHIGWSCLKNRLFKHYLSIRNNIHGAINFTFCCWFDICNLIVSSASSFWDFRIPPFNLRSCTSCPGGVAIMATERRVSSRKGVYFKMIYLN